MENQTPPTERDTAMADLWELFNFLDAHPDLPIGNNGIGKQCVTAADDEAGIAEIRRIAGILGVEIGDNGSSIDACRMFGTQPYRAFYCRREFMRRHHEEQAYLAERRKAVETRPCAECGTPVATAGVEKDEWYCSTACAEGEAVES